MKKQHRVKLFSVGINRVLCKNCTVIRFICTMALFLAWFNNGSTEAQEKGKEVLLRLDPGPDNPRNSEGDFIELKDGRILFVYSHFTGSSSGDSRPAYLAGRYSSDSGRTWTTESEKIIDREGLMNVMSVSLLRLQSGVIALFYNIKNSLEDCMPVMRISKDEAITWGEPVKCIPERKGYFVLNNDRVIQLESGRLLLAVSRHGGTGEEFTPYGTLLTYYSDDSGKTWKEGGQVPNPENIITQEPGLIELKNGDILMFIRTDAGVQCFSRSEDGGLTWTDAEPGNLKSPVSPASIKRIPSTGDLLAVWNNNNTDNRRTPLTIAISKDEGETWEKVKNIEDEPGGWYCYTAIHFTGNHVLLGHSAGNTSIHPKLKLSPEQITRLSLELIYR